MEKHKGTSTDRGVAQQLHEALVEDQDTQKFSDFVVAVDDVEFKCHRIVLSTRSGFFRSLFSSSMKETAEGKASLQRMSSDIFAVVLKWMYEGDACITKENVFDVLFAADLLDIQCLMSECKHILVNILSLNNCVSIYHTSKIINDQRLIDISFRWLLKHFDLVCASEELYKLNADDLKALVSHSGLISRSEDVIIENIMKWVHFEMNSSSLEEQKIDVNDDEEEDAMQQGTSTKSNRQDNPTESGSLSTLEVKSSMQENLSISVEAQLYRKDLTETLQRRNTQDKDSPHRAQLLADILKSTRYLLVSGNCLWQTLACDILVQSDQRCQNIVDAIVRYNTRLDSHQDSIRAPAEHRSSDQLVDVVLTCTDNEIHYCYLATYFVQLDLECPVETIQGMACFENNIYTRNEKSEVYAYSFKFRTWGKVTRGNERDVKTLAMLPVGNELVALSTDDNVTYVVESMSVKSHGQAQWDQIGEFITCGLQVASVTNIGSKLIVFWRQANENYLKIECFDLVHRKSVVLEDQIGSTSQLVTFKRDDEAFALQDDGSLWRFCLARSKPYITIKHELWLWDFHRAVDGAILVGDVLMIFETTEKTNVRQQTQKAVRLDNIFTDIKFVETQPTKTGYIHVALNGDMFI